MGKRVKNGERGGQGWKKREKRRGRRKGAARIFFKKGLIRVLQHWRHMLEAQTLASAMALKVKSHAKKEKEGKRGGKRLGLLGEVTRA